MSRRAPSLAVAVAVACRPWRGTGVDGSGLTGGLGSLEVRIETGVISECNSPLRAFWRVTIRMKSGGVACAMHERMGKPRDACAKTFVGSQHTVELKERLLRRLEKFWRCTGARG